MDFRGENKMVDKLLTPATLIDEQRKNDFYAIKNGEDFKNKNQVLNKKEVDMAELQTIVSNANKVIAEFHGLTTNLETKINNLTELIADGVVKLGIGAVGEVLTVSASGMPEWA